MKMRIAIMAAVLPLAGCGGHAPQSASAKPVVTDWRRVVTTADFTRLRGWRTALMQGVDQAKAGGKGDEVAREGVLLEPDAALDAVALPAGRYRCRILKLGANGTAMATFTPYPPFDCAVTAEGSLARFVKTSGSQRPVGTLYDDGSARKIFLGSLMLGDESRPLDYGRDAARDMVGAVQRIGDKRWRMILPYPRFESVVDVVELVPAA